MTQVRDCGGCVACCIAPLIDDPELQKPPQTVCTHCTGTACGIHERKPTTCSEFTCEWALGKAGTDAQRPDTVGIIESFLFDIALGLPRILFETRVGTLKEPYAQERLKALIAKGSCVITLEFDLTQRLIVPKRDSISKHVIQQLLADGADIVYYDEMDTVPIEVPEPAPPG